ncbi:hypothetical protein F503_06853 [Ophiostoma piceae UAMH 11346]|uniref:RING-CH-type domain-containing protein n=1 Tax=Ophiostoma piceae (strain UAMH 11346) TaxID=1262450 RepID=S3C8A8_OPHP1|nr:hypothetical protein F503_06853 [Ophiostoma piceae UAMH 11346]
MDAGEPGPEPYDDMPPLVDVDGSDIIDSNDDAAEDPLADDTRTCFICLQTPDEDPTAAWVAPCPCTLTAHQDCLLQWIDGKERSGAAINDVVDNADNVEDVEVVDDVNNANANANPGPRPRDRPRLRATRKVRCPACDAPIYTLESPPDFWVHIGDSFANKYKYYFAPHILATMAATMAIAGSSYYGFSMFMSVAGPDKVVAWLAGGRPVDFGMLSRRTVSTSLTGRLFSHPADVLWTNARMALLGLVAPTLLLQRAIPLILYGMTAPVTWVWGLEQTLLRYWRTRTVRGALVIEWPPSASTVIMALPNISIAYAMAYNSIFGRLEQRLDRALGHVLEPYVDDNAGAGAAAADNDNGPAAPDAAQAQAPVNPGIFGLVRRVGGAVANMVRGNNNGPNHHHHNHIDEHIEFQIEVVVGGADDVPDHVHFDDRMEEAVVWDDMLGEAPAAPPPNIERRPQQQQQQQQQPQQQPAAAPANDNQIRLFPDQFSIRGAIAASTSQLLLPSIASTMGDLLWLVMPASLTTARQYSWRRERFLSQRWARSLVGGALFLVLRDLLKLYGKYRRVQTRGLRTVKNYDRKQHREERRRAEEKRERERRQQRELVEMREARAAGHGVVGVVDI